MKRYNATFVIFLMMASMLIIPTPVNALRYSMDTDLADVDASFIGEVEDDFCGKSVAGAGDVNGDGYDDILIGVWENCEGGTDAGQTYLILGNATDLAMDTDLANVSASFIAEDWNDYSGWSVAGAGDVNGDGYEDILIGAVNDNEGGASAGQTYLIFGKVTGWAMDTNLSSADASFIGEKELDVSGVSVAGAGDVNGDGYYDILIGAYYNDEGGNRAGQTYLILGKATGWAKDTDLSNAEASFIGEDATDYSGGSVAGAGDVNGDGYDDILIGAGGDDDGGSSAGQTYLILGKSSGWAMDTDLSNADASFIGENSSDFSGRSLAGVGDVNGDGYNDILIGANGNDEGGSSAGQTYLILGKSSGWAMDTDLSNANASFIGEIMLDNSGLSVAGGGDVNGDGYDDILIGAYYNDEGGGAAGQTYLILGKSSGWTMDTNLSNVDASFIGEAGGDRSGRSVAGTGDVNGDGYDDILIGATHNDEGGSYAGQIYLIFPDNNSKPSSISYVKAFSDDTCSNEISKANINDTIYIELQGTDENNTRKDIAVVNVRSSKSSPIGFRLRLFETGLNTGKYRGNFTIKNRTNDDYSWIKALNAETVSISSVQDPSKNATMIIGEIVLYPLSDNYTAQEDVQYNENYFTQGWSNVNWHMDTNASWLEWNSTSHNISGTPDNSDIGSYWVRINISNGPFFSDEHNFTMVVNNTPPDIITDDIYTTIEDQEYFVDYNSSDDGQGVITWHITSNASSWLQIDSIDGNLNGTPTNSDAGSYWVNVSVDDGNGGWDSSNFTLYVINANDLPEILTINKLTALEDEEYNITYEALDIDTEYGDKIKWHVESNTSFLTMDSSSGVLSGIPTNDDVGVHWVNVTVSDLALASVSQNFTMTVINVNDPPIIASEPILEVTALYLYEYQLNVTDVDIGDILTYSLDTSPDNMVINEISGLITWIPEPEQEGDNLVLVRVGDGNESDTQEFNIKVIPPDNYAPWVTLISPTNGSTVNETNPTLTWSFDDPDSEEIQYYVYLHTDQSKVRTFDPISQLEVDQTGESYMATSLTKGTVYYWTVIPDDGEATGKCLSGIWWFKVSEAAELNIAPVITSDPVKSVTIGEQYRYEVIAEDDNKDDVLEFFLIVHPGNMIIDVDSGVILWTPNQNQLGNPTITVKVSDGRLFGLQTFEIDVTIRNNKPEVTAIPEQTIMVGEDFSYQVAVIDADITDILTYKLEDAPTGIIINSVGIITWVPGKDQVGKHIITLNVSDGKDHTAIEFTVNVKKEVDMTSSDSGSAIQASIIIVIIVIIALLALTMIMMKRKKAQKDKLGPLDVPDQEVLQPEMISSPPAPQTTASTADVPQSTQTTMTADENTVPVTLVQDASQLGAAPVPEMTDRQLPQIPQVQPTPQLPPAKSTTELEPAPIPQIEMPQENVTSVVEAPVMETEPQPLPQVQETQTSIAPKVEPIQPAQQEQIPTEESQSIPPNLCSTCSQPLTFYSQNNKYYCHQCKKYE